MALSDDQRAMLRLLAQREQGYEDMAALMGVSVEELRRRVGEALSELEREGARPPEPGAGGEAPGPEATARPLEAPTEAKARPGGAPTEDTTRPGEAPGPANAPAGEAGREAAEPPAPSATAAAEAPRRRRGISLPSSTGARIGAAAVAAATVVVVVLLLALGGGDGGSGAATANGPANGSATSGGVVGKAIASTESGKGREVTKAVLAPVGGGEARGVAIFGRVKNRLALQIVAERLAPLGAGESYAIWVAQSPRRMLPLAASPVRKNGTIASQFEVPTELLAFLANETFDEIAITRASNSRLDKALKAATKAKRTPDYTGAPVMRGEITGPIVGAAKRIEEQAKRGK